MYLTGQLIEDSFLRLRYVAGSGKSGAERTSAMMYFLAFDAVHRSHKPYTLDPRSKIGQQNRNELASQFCRVAAVRNISKNDVLSVSDLGALRTGTPPEKRISSNFLTVPMKKASQKSIPTEYPGRPVPVLMLGPGLGPGSWAIGPHNNWEQNIAKLFDGRKTKTPFTDLAIFVFRDAEFLPAESLESTLNQLISARFSKNLGGYWKKKLAWERRFFSNSDKWFAEEHHGIFQDDRWLPKTGNQDNIKKLTDRIEYLESILNSAKIKY